VGMDFCSLSARTGVPVAIPLPNKSGGFLAKLS